jgi:hypothetical protein
MSSDATEVMVIAAPQGAALALGTYRPQHERTHLLCRWPDEHALAFSQRVTKRLASIQQGATVAALTFVLGSDPLLHRLWSGLSHELASVVAPTGSLLVVGIGASQAMIVEWVDLLRGLVEPSVSLGAWFPGAAI